MMDPVSVDAFRFIDQDEPLGGASVPTQELGRDEFLKLLVAKLENQDPLEPANDTEFISELATFSSLEQLIDVNANLEALAGAQDQLINAQTLNLIGKRALVESGNDMRIKNGQADQLVYIIPRQAAEAELKIVDENGETVKTFELETTPNGRVTIAWDGKNDEGELLPDGDYRLDVNVVDGDGNQMTIGLFSSLRIDGVNFIGGDIGLVSGDRELPFEQILEIRENSEV